MNCKSPSAPSDQSVVRTSSPRPNLQRISGNELKRGAPLSQKLARNTSRLKIWRLLALCAVLVLGFAASAVANQMHARASLPGRLQFSYASHNGVADASVTGNRGKYSTAHAQLGNIYASSNGGSAHAEHHGGAGLLAENGAKSGASDALFDPPLLGSPGSTQYVQQTWMPSPAVGQITVAWSTDSFLQVDPSELTADVPLIVVNVSQIGEANLVGSVELSVRPPLPPEQNAQFEVNLTGIFQGLAYHLDSHPNGVVSLRFVQPPSWTVPGDMETFAIGLESQVTPNSSVCCRLIGNNGGGATTPSNIFGVNTGTGGMSGALSTGVLGLVGIAADPSSGELYGLTSFGGAPANTLVKINPTTGASTVVGNTGLTIQEGDLAFNPVDGQLYAAWDQSGGGRNLFKINPITGVGTNVGSLGSSGDFSALAFNSVGTLYVVDTDGNGTSSFLKKINPATAATLTTTTMNVKLGSVAGLAFDPDTGIAYVADGNVGGTHILYTLNTANGQATVVGPVGDSVAGLTFLCPPKCRLLGNNGGGPATPSNIFDINTGSGAMSGPLSTGVRGLVGIAANPTSGEVYGLTSFGGAPANTLVKINVTTGASTVVGNTGLTIQEGDLAFNPMDGQLYAAWDQSGGTRDLFKINPSTGAATTVGSLGSSGDFSALAFNSAGTLFVVDTDGNGTSSFLKTVSPATAATLTTTVMNVKLGSVAGLAFDPDTGIAYVADGNVGGTHILYTLNTVNGQATVVGPVGDSVAGLTFVCPPACVVAPRNLVLWLPFDEAAGPLARNAVGGNNGTHVSGPIVVNQYVGRGLQFDGSASVNVPDYPAINPGTGDLSIDAWVKRDPASGNGVRIIVDKRGANGVGYGLAISFGNLIFTQTDASGQTNHRDTGIVPADNQWHFVAVSVNRVSPTGGRFYVDGNATGTFNPTLRPGSLSNPAAFKVGASPLGGNSPWLGCIDEVEVFRRALAPHEVFSLYNAGTFGKCKSYCNLLWDRNFCGAPTLNTVATIRNTGGVAQTYHYSFHGLPAMPNAIPPCPIAGPTSFTPAFGSITVQPGQTATIPVTIGHHAGNQVGCYEMVVEVAATCETFRCRGSVFDSVLCGNLPFLVELGTFSPALLQAVITNKGATPVSLPFQILVERDDMQPDQEAVRLNGLPPGIPVTSTLTLAPSQSMTVNLQVEFLQFDPLRPYTLLIQADLDGDGEFEPLDSTTLQNVLLPTLELQSAVSRMTHGAAGVFDLPLPLSGNPGVECRRPPPGTPDDICMVFAFNNAVFAGHATVTGTATVNGTPTFSGNQMMVSLTGVANVQTITVTLSDVTDMTGQVLADTSVNIGILQGDVNGSRVVNSTDIVQVKSVSGQPVNASNFRRDVNASGVVNSTDIVITKSRSGSALP